jgi:hypothetical protein
MKAKEKKYVERLMTAAHQIRTVRARFHDAENHLWNYFSQKKYLEEYGEDVFSPLTTMRPMEDGPVELFLSNLVFFESYPPQRWIVLGPIGAIAFPGSPWEGQHDRLKFFSIDSATFPPFYNVIYVNSVEDVTNFFNITEEDILDCGLLVEDTHLADVWLEGIAVWDPDKSPQLISNSSFQKWKQGKEQWDPDEVADKVTALAEKKLGK